MILRVLVIGEDVAKQMAPFNACLKGPFRETLGRDALRRLCAEYGFDPDDRDSVRDCLRQHFGPGTQTKFSGGEVQCRLSRNPKAKFHACSIGEPFLRLRAHEDIGQRVMRARKREVEQPICVTHAIVKNGQWYESDLWRYRGGAVVPHPFAEWKARFDQLLAATDDDELLSGVWFYRAEEDVLRPPACVGGRDQEPPYRKTVRIIHQSVDRGEANPSGEPSTIYLGLANRIPQPEFGGPDTPLTERNVDESLDLLLKEYRDYSPVKGGPLEHYDVVDAVTGDVIELWRAPYRRRSETDSIDTHSAASKQAPGRSASVH